MDHRHMVSIGIRKTDPFFSLGEDHREVAPGWSSNSQVGEEVYVVQIPTVVITVVSFTGSVCLSSAEE